MGFAQSDLIDCYRDTSVLHHIGSPFSEAFQSLGSGRIGDAMKAPPLKSNLGPDGVVLGEFGCMIYL